VAGLMGLLAPLSWLFLAAAILLHAAFAASLGLCLSVVSRSTTRAYVAFATIIVSLTAGTWSVQYLTNEASEYRQPEGERVVVPQLAIDAINPVQSWWTLMTNDLKSRYSRHAHVGIKATLFDEDGYWDRQDRTGDVALTFLATFAVYGPANILLWRLAIWRF